MTNTTETKIERRLDLNAPIERVWEAIATPKGFAGWFSARVEGDWKEGQSVALIWPSGNSNEILLKTISPMEEFAYLWHPGEYAKLNDYPTDQLTRVTMRLRSTASGTEIHMVESGFETIPEDRKLRVLGLNNEGWDEELENIRKYVER